VDFFRGHGVKHVVVDSDGDPTLLIPLLLDAGVDTILPIERASDVSPREWRRRFGRQAIRAHLREFIPLVEEGGFIPTVDHTVQPGVSWDNFRQYMEAKKALLAGEFAKLGA
jgi:uroporphyrinogen decarboxylase